MVTALDAVKGNVADCDGTSPQPARPEATRTSPDGTLAYRWEHRGEGERHFTAWWLHEGEWQVALEEVWAAR